MHQNSYTHSLSTLVITAVITTFMTMVVVFTVFLPIFFDLDAGMLTELFRKHWIRQDPPRAEQDVTLHANPVRPQITPRTVTSLPSPVHEVTSQDSVIKEHQHAVTLTIQAGQQLSYWLVMERDYPLDYRWQTDGKPLFSEFRGERNKSSPSEYETFKKITKAEAGGLFISPFAGKFGWLWLNNTKEPIQVHLSVKGEFAIDSDSDSAGNAMGQKALPK